MVFLTSKENPKFSKSFIAVLKEEWKGSRRLEKILLLCSSYRLGMTIDEYPEVLDKTRPNEQH